MVAEQGLKPMLALILFLLEAYGGWGWQDTLDTICSGHGHDFVTTS